MSKISLIDICNITTGKLDANAAVENGDYPYFTCAPEPLRIDKYDFEGNVILLAGNNASGNFHCQRFNGKFNAYQRTYVITAKKGYDIDYIYYNLKINLEHFKKISQGSQTKFLTMTILEGFLIEDIDLKKQKKMIRVLSLIDKKIELNRITINDLEQILKTIYNYWFLQFEFPIKDGNLYKSSGGKMIWNEELKKEIPEGWNVKKVGEILAKISNTYKYTSLEYKEDGKFPIIDQSSNFICGYTDKEEDLLKLNDCVVFGDHTKFVKYVNFDFARGADGTQILDSSDERLPNYLLYMQISNMQLVSQGYSRYFKFLKDKHVIIPEKEISDMYISNVKIALEKIKKCREENKELSNLRDYLLPLLMNGQVGF